MTMTADELIQVVALRMLDLRVETALPRASWGFVSWGESDLLVIDRSDRLKEYEAKSAPGDLMREWTKKRWTDLRMLQAFQERIWKYHVVVPSSIPKSTLDTWLEKAPPDLRPGVIRVTPEGLPLVMATAAPNKAARKTTMEERAKMGRLGMLRYWDIVRDLPMQKSLVERYRKAYHGVVDRAAASTCADRILDPGEIAMAKTLRSGDLK